MQRREFITLLGGTTVTWPLAARAQQPAMPVIGYLHSDSPQPMAHLLAAFREGLRETGYVEGRNVVIEYRWGKNGEHRLSELVADLVSRGVAVIATPGTSAGALAAKAATTTIPIVFSLGVDPVKLGLVASLARPGGNVTGINSMSNELMAKRFGLLRELLPAARRIAVLDNPLNATSQSQIDDANAAARTIGLQIEVFKADDGTAIDKAFATLMQSRTDALLIGPDAMFNNRRDQIAALSVRHRLPTIFSFRTDAEAGGLMSYGTSLTDAHRLAGVYTGRILKGEKPADLPVQQPTKYELAINIKTAKAWFDRTAVAARHRRRGDRIRVGCLFLADIVAKVFLGWRSKILNAVDAFYARRREGPHRFIQNRSRTSVVALKSDAAAEKSKDQLSRDF